MRRFTSGLLVAGILLFCNSTQAMAQKTPAGGELNQRIQALRDRLQNFQSRRIAKNTETPQVECSELILDQFEAKEEKIVEELESRSDVAVTVLFHDTDTVNNLDGEVFANAPANEDEVVAQKAEPAKVLMVRADKAEKLVAKRDVAPVQIAAKNTAGQNDSRLSRYEELRQRVYLATRNARAQAMDINRQIARIH